MKISNSLTVNWHSTPYCNFKCRYCFVSSVNSLKLQDYLITLKKLKTYFSRINFVRGEPTISPFLPHLVQRAKNIGFDCTLVTNGFNLIHKPNRFKPLYPILSCIGISIDSLYKETNLTIGRCCKNRTITKAEYSKLCHIIKSYGIRLKINTVVSKLNLKEDFNDFYSSVNPDRIKLFQVLKPNTCLKENYDDLLISKKEYDRFILRHKVFNDKIIAEDNEAMTNAYYILDSESRFIDNRTGIKSPALIQKGMTVENTLKYIDINTKKYWARYSA